MSQEGSEIENPDQLSEVRREVSLQSVLMFDIVSDNERFVEKLKDLNQSGITCILKEKYQEALIYLQEAEKLLEFAASCGKTIDRGLIIFTLQNEACIYQRLWELEKASNYLEAIIFNMNGYMESSPEPQINSIIFQSLSESYNHTSNYITKRLNVAMYELKFSAISSQIRKHQVALASATKALSVLKIICQDCLHYEKQMQKQNNINQEKSILKELANLKEQVDLDNKQTYFKLTVVGLKKIKQKQFTPINKKQQKEKEQLHNFSIGQVMQISPISMANLQKMPDLQNQLYEIQKIYKAIYISICFFAISTELRFIASELYTEEEKENCQEYQKSKLYHLCSISIVCRYLPEQNYYLQHILKSFNSHYSIDLESQIKNCPQQEQVSFNFLLKDYNTGSEKINWVTLDEEQKISKSKKQTLTKINFVQSQRSLDNAQSISGDKTKTLEYFGIKKHKNKSKGKSIEKHENNILLKQNYFGQHLKARKSHRKSKDGKKSLNHIAPNLSKEKKKLNKSKSIDRSRSNNSKRQVSFDQKERSYGKKNKKTEKLRQQYLMNQNTKKKIVSPKPTLTKEKMSDYMAMTIPSKHSHKRSSSKIHVHKYGKI